MECIRNANPAAYEIFKKWGNLLRNIRKGSLATDGDIQDTGVHVVNTVLPTAAEAKFMLGSRSWSAGNMPQESASADCLLV
jgi:hypothetical protein